MTRDIRDVLSQYSADHDVVERLHAVPPHEVWAVTLDGRRAVCKRATHPDGDPETEAVVIDHVDRDTSVPVPSILATGQDHFVAEWRDDAPSEAEAVTDETTVRALARTMATLHRETTFPAYGFPESGDGSITVDARGSWPAVVRAHLRDCRRYLDPLGYGEAAALVSDLLADRPALLAGRDDPVLCHGNLLPGHVATEDGHVTCVLDFEHALSGPPEYDYWRTVMPVFEAGVDPGVAESVFRRGYESVRPLPDGLDERRRIYRLVNLVSYLRALDLQNHGIGEAERARADDMAGTIRAGVEALRRSDGA